MQKTLAEIAKAVKGEMIGPADLMITGLSGIREAKTGDLTFLASSKYSSLVKETKASAILVSRNEDVDGISLIRTDDPSLAFAAVSRLFYEDDAIRVEGIHPTAVIDSSVRIGKDVTVGPYTIVKNGAVIGDNTYISSGCFIGHDSRIGSGGVIYPNVVIRERISIGNRVIVHSGTVIGSDGFGYANVNGVQEKIPQIGTVEIHDDVEIGACVTIDRARSDKTVVGQGTKIDNLVQIAHNVIIGKNCILCAQVGISGSCVVEDNVVLAGQVGLAGHLTVGEGAVIASGSGVPSDVPAHSTYWGFPAKPHQHAKRVNACVQRLPLYVKAISDLKRKIEELEARLNGSKEKS